MRKCVALRRWLLGAAVLASAGFAAADTVNITAQVETPSPAEIVNIYFNDVPQLGSPGLPAINGLSAYAGVIKWTDETDDSNLDTGGNLLQSLPSSFFGTFGTYCIDLTQDISVGQTVPFDQLTNVLDVTPVIGGNTFSMTSTAAAQIQNLYNNDYTASPSDDQAAAFQIAIWDIIYGVNASSTNINVADTSGANRFWITGASSAVTNMADQYVEAAIAGSVSGPNVDILALTDENYQDQLIVGTPLAPAPPSTPTPSAAISGMVLLGGLSVVKRLRRVR